MSCIVACVLDLTISTWVEHIFIKLNIFKLRRDCSIPIFSEKMIGEPNSFPVNFRPNKQKVKKRRIIYHQLLIWLIIQTVGFSRFSWIS